MENENPIINPVINTANEIAPVPSPDKPPAEPSAKQKFRFNKNHLFLGVAVLAIIITGAVLAGKTGFLNFVPAVNPFGMSQEAVAKKAIDYINKNLIAQGSSAASLGAVSEDHGVIKMEVKLGKESFVSYVTKDGKLFFVEGISLE